VHEKAMGLKEERALFERMIRLLSTNIETGP